MTTTSLKQTKESNALRLNAEQEGVIGCKQLLQEIVPLIKEYFIGNFELTEEAIQLNFYNGQKFSITINELKNN